MKARAGYTKKDILTAITDLVKSGGNNSAHRLFSTKTPEKDRKRLRKALKASEAFQIKNETVWDKYGNKFDGYASWGPEITVRMLEYDHRFRVLHIDRFGIRTVYAVPIAKADNLNGIPHMDLGQNELSVIQNMAKELESYRVSQERFTEVKHPSKETIKELTKSWTQAPEREILESLLQSQPVLLQIAVAALDCQLRAFNQFRTAPKGIYNFLMSQDVSSSDWFMTAMRALTFANEPGRMGCGPIIIQLKDAEDLKRWRKCHERMAVIVTSRGSLLWSLLKEIEEDERIAKSGGPLPEVSLPTLPISICRSVLDSPYAADIKLPDTLPPLTKQEQDVLRSAIAKLLHRSTADKVYKAWQKKSASPFAYRNLEFQTWQNILLEYMTEVWFPGQTGQDLYVSVTQKRDQERQEMADTLKRAVELLIHTEKYESEILPERPKSKKEAKKVLSNDAVTFWFTPDKGKDKGHTLLAFSGDSLKRLLQRADCGEELYDAFLQKCDHEGLLDNRNRSITLSGETFTAVTFLAKKF